MFVWIEDDSPEMKAFEDKIDEYQRKRDRKTLQNCGESHFKIKEVKRGKNKGKIKSIAVTFIKYTKEEIANFSEKDVEINSNNTEAKWVEYGVFFGRKGE